MEKKTNKKISEKKSVKKQVNVQPELNIKDIVNPFFRCYMKSVETGGIVQGCSASIDIDGQNKKDDNKKLYYSFDNDSYILITKVINREGEEIKNVENFTSVNQPRPNLRSHIYRGEKFEFISFEEILKEISK